MTTVLNTEQQAALDIARRLAQLGIPLFVAPPDPGHATGFALPNDWQQTPPDPTGAVVDRWQPGWALCAVMGQGIDLIDIDIRNGGDPAAMNGSTPRCYGVALTPSGGAHSFIASTGAGSRDGVFPGIDVKSGTPEGTGRGFAFLAPTVRVSKTTGQPTPYRWGQPPDLDALGAVLSGEKADVSGAKLAARIRELKSSGGVRKVGGPDWWREFLANREPQSAATAEKAINEKLSEVADWNAASGTGFRTVLLRAAMTLGGYVGGGYLDEAVAQERLEAAVSEIWGNPDSDDLLWISQGLTDGAEQPFPVYTPEDERAWSEAAQVVAAQGEDPHRNNAFSGVNTPPPEPPWNIFSVLGGEPFDPRLDSSDQGLAEAVAARMYPVLRYAKDAGAWVKRERDVWEEFKDTIDVPHWIVSQMAKLMPLGQTPVPKEVTERTEAHWQAVRRAQFMSSGGTGKISRKLRALVHSDHPAALRVADLDTNPEVLWAGGVPWDLRTSGDAPTAASWVDPNTPHLHTALCAPNPAIPTPRWNAFLTAVLPDPEVRAWALRVLSIALTGYADAALPVLYGRERSGKTSLIEMIVTVLGSYAHAANPKLLSAQDASHDAIIYDLKGRRLSFIDEGPKRGYESTERLKQLTGGGSLTAAKKYGNPITFRPTHTLVMTTNNEPHLTDPALRARMRLIPCDALEVVVRSTRLPLLGYGLVTEAPGILAQLMREAAAYLADRDSAGVAAAPPTIRGLATEMSENQDPVREWVSDCTVPADPGTPGRKLYTQFAGWHQNHPLYRRMSVPTETAFGRTLTDMGYPSHKQSGSWYRPLSVLGGPGMPTPTPTPAQFMVGEGSTAEGSQGSGGSAAGQGGSEGQPASAENTRSTPILSSLSGGLAGIEREKSIGEGERDREGIRGENKNTELAPDLPAKRLEDSANRPLTCDDEAGGSRFGDPPGLTDGLTDSSDQLNIPGIGPIEGISTSGLTSENVGEAPRKITNTDVARRATGQSISKAEARAQLKAEQRLAAIREATGEVLALPAVVDRAQHVLPVTPEQAAAVVRRAIRETGALTVDVETSGYPVGHELYELRSVQLGDDTAAVVLHPTEHAELIRALLAEAPRLHAHSATADLVPTALAGLVDAESAWARMYDTVIPAKLADPTSTGADPGLKKLAPAMLGEAAVSPAADEARSALFKAGRWLTETKVTTPVEKSGWAQVQSGCVTMLRYAASDVLDTAALARVLPAPALSVHERERLAQRMTARVAHRGVRIDVDQVYRLTDEAVRGRDEAAGRARAFGIENPGSDQQVGVKAAELGAELPRTATGRPSVAAGVLEPLREAEGPLGVFVNAILDYRHHDTVLGTFLEPYRLLCERGDGRARPTVYTLGTDTGRMSCVRPNLQQLPRKGGVRACITADPGQLMIGADFSGVEIRVAAALSQDPTLLRLIAEGRDLHAEIALQVFGPDAGATAKAGGVPTAGKEHRYIAKRIVFGRLYGGGIPTLATQAGCDHATAQRAVDTLDAITPVLTGWSSSVRDAVKQGVTQFPSYSGRIIHLPRDYPHKSPNYCIQGTAREILVDALARWADTRWGKCVLLPVHDELDIFVPEEDAEEAAQELVRCMEMTLYGVKIVAEPSTPSFAWQDSV
jgi:P4 family phage/plasmid primase-like protien